MTLAPGWASLPPAALALGRPRVVAVAAVAVLAFGALLGATAAPGPDSAVAGRVYVAGLSTPAPAPDVTGSAASSTGDAPDTSPVDTSGDAAAPVPAETATSSPAPAQTTPTNSGADTGSTTPAGTTTPAATSPAPVKHVWLISMDTFSVGGAPTASAAQATPAPTTGGLADAGTVLPAYASVTSGSLANSVTLISGLDATAAQRGNCATYSAVEPGTVSAKTGLVSGDGCVEPAQAVTLADRLTGAGLVWRAYAEDIGAGPADQTSCRHPDLGAADPFAAPRPGDAYLTWRNPFVYFRSITESADCGTAVVGLDRLAPDLAAVADTPALSYVVPDACHDGSATPCAPGAPAGADAAGAWLGTVIPQIQASPAYADGGLVVVAALDGPRPDAASTGGVPVGALLLSPYVAAGASVSAPYDHLSLLKTLALIFGVPAPGRAAGAGVKAFGAKVFTNAPAAGGD